MTEQAIYSGSSREVKAFEPGVIEFRIGEFWSAGDKGRSRQPIPGMGWARHRCAIQSFEIAIEAGVPTHYVRHNGRSFLAEEFKVPNHPPLSGETVGEILDGEWIWRLDLEGSLWERVKSGEIGPVELGFPRGYKPRQGERLPRIKLECTTKYEPRDRKLTDEEARDRMRLSMAEWNEAWEMIEKLARAIDAHARRRGFKTPDGKKEMARRWKKTGGGLLVADTFGTPDENRFIGLHDGLIYSKDIIRNELKKVGYMAELKAAQDENTDDPDMWPDYPELSAETVSLVQARYDAFASAYAR